MTDNNTQNATQQQNTTQPEGNGTAGKTFTQEEVNTIVRERLARERAKGAANDDSTERETDLKAREDALNARLARLDRDAKRSELASILKDIGVFERRISPILEDSKRAEAIIQEMELDENGKVKNRAALMNLAKTDFSDYIATVKTVGAPVAHPMEETINPTTDILLKRAFGLND